MNYLLTGTCNWDLRNASHWADVVQILERREAISVLHEQLRERQPQGLARLRDCLARGLCTGGKSSGTQAAQNLMTDVGWSAFLRFQTFSNFHVAEIVAIALRQQKENN